MSSVLKHPNIVSTAYGGVYLPSDAKLPKVYYFNEEPSTDFLVDKKGDLVYFEKGRKIVVCYSSTKTYHCEVRIPICQNLDTDDTDWLKWAQEVAIFVYRVTKNNNELFITLLFPSHGCTARRSAGERSVKHADKFVNFEIQIRSGTVEMAFTQTHRYLFPEWRGSDLPICDVVNYFDFEPIDSHTETPDFSLTSRTRGWCEFSIECWRRAAPRRWIEFHEPIPRRDFDEIKRDALLWPVLSRAKLSVVVSCEESIEEFTVDAVEGLSYCAGLFVYDVDCQTIVDTLNRYSFDMFSVSPHVDVKYANRTIPTGFFSDEIFVESDDESSDENGTVMKLYSWHNSIAPRAHLRWPVYQILLVELSLPLLQLIHSPFCIMLILEYLEHFQFRNWSEHIRLTTIQRVFDSTMKIDEQREEKKTSRKPHTQTKTE